MKNKLLLLTFFTFSLTSFGQSPEGINYQAVIRDATNNIISTQNVGVQFRLLQGSPAGTADYTETHNILTDGYGLVALAIGTGNTSDDFSTIDWSNGPYFLEIAADVSGGTSYSVLGTQQLMSVPYALYAKTSGSTAPSDKITDTDNNTKIQVEESPNEDIIRFDLAGTERWTMTGAQLEPANSGESVFIGENAGANDDLTSNRNVFIGYNTGQENTIGVDNTATGHLALNKNTNGGYNTATGASSLENNTTGSLNTGLGVNALKGNTTGGENAALGSNALNSNSTGDKNTAIGRNALLQNSSGSGNVAVGNFSLISNKTGNNNTAIGNNSGATANSLNNTTAIGNQAKVATSNSLVLGGTGGNAVNVGIGTTSPTELLTLAGTSGTDGILFPDNTLQTTAFTGSTTSGDNITDADNNTKIQVEETANEDIIRFDVAGTEFFTMTNGRLNILNTGRTVAIGNNAGLNDDLSFNENTFIGDEAGTFTTSGNTNVAIGSLALEENETGNNNTAIGAQALNNNTGGSNNTALGYKANVSSGNLNNATAIGNRANVATSNSLVLGGIGTDAVKVGIGTTSPTELLTLTGTSGTDGILFPDNTLQTTAFTGTATVDEITDADNNTKIQVEETANDDIIRFDIAGTEQWKMEGAQLAPVNSGRSIFIGEGAGINDDLTEHRNVFIGYNTGQANTIGNGNTATGANALNDNISGSNNTATGVFSLNNNTVGSYNTAIGSFALENNTLGDDNAAIGAYALNNNTIGNQNTALGINSLNQNTSGNNNVAMGPGALLSNFSGNNNTAIGYNADVLLPSLNNTTAIGAGAKVATNNSLVLGGTIANGNAVNVGIGTDSPTELLTLAGTSGTDGILFPDNTLQTTAFTGTAPVDEITDADNNTKIQVEETANDDIIRFDIAGTERLKIRLNTNGVTMIEPNNNNGGVFLGVNAGSNATLGGANTFIGAGTGKSITNGSSNTFIGYGAGFDAVTGSRNVMLGSGAGSSSSGSDNVFIGNNAGSLESGSNKLYIENTSSSTPLIYGEFDNDLVKVNGDLDVTGQYLQNGNPLLPVGSIQMYMGSTAPAGWLICDGATFSAATYPALNTLLGSNIVPDFSGRMPIGVGNNGTQGGANHALGGFGGEENHKLTSPEMPSHSHSTLITYREGSEQGSGNNYSDLGGTATTGTSYTSAATGGNQPHNNMSPYYVVNFIIKAN